MFENLSSKQLSRAAQIKEKIESLQNELDALVGSPGSTRPGGSSSSGAAKGKGPISAAGLARIKAAQRARWAKFRKEKGLAGTGNGSAASSASNGKRAMSPAARAKIRAIAKARWAKAKAAGKTSL